MKEPSLLRLLVRSALRIFNKGKCDSLEYLNMRDGLWWRYKIGAFKNPESGEAGLGAFRVHFRRFEDLMRVLEEIWGVESYSFKTQKSTPLIFDLGANIGISLLYFKKHYPHARIQAFEPDPANFEILQKNVSRNLLQDVMLHPLALSAEEGELEFFSNEESLVSSAYGARVEQTVQAKSYPVKAVRLSSFITEEIDFLKMDIEGSEWEVIRELAASGKLQKIREMVIEYHHHMEPSQDRLAGFLQILEGAGFAYVLSSPFIRDASGHEFQDVLIHAVQKA